MGLFGEAMARLTIEPIFGPTAFGADSTCDDVHPHGPIPSGHRRCCMVCHRTGVENHPYLRCSAEDKAALAAWKPPESGDQWSEPDWAPLKPRRTEPAAITRKARRAQDRRGLAERIDRAVPMDPDEIGRLVDGGYAVPAHPID